MGQWFSSETGTTGNVRVIKVEEFKQRKVSVMVAGRPRQGKSTALNNIFDLNLEARLSAESVTKHVSSHEYKQNDVAVTVIDTPGLGALDVTKEEVLAEMRQLKIKNDFTLLYCFSVDPNNTLTETDAVIIRNIQSIFGKWVWNRCILVLTCCDLIREKEFPSDEQAVEYIAFLRSHVERFYKVIQNCGAEVSGVKLLFDYSRQDFELQTKSDKLVAVPAAKKKTINVIPGLLFDPRNYWTDYAFMEILKKADEIECDVLLCFKHNIVSTLKGAAEGGAIGAVYGGGLGAVCGAAAAVETGALVAIPAGAVAVGGAIAVPVAATVLAVGIPASVAWMAIQALRK